MAKSVVINGVTYPDVPSVNIPGTDNNDVTFYETSDATAGTAQVLTGYTFYKNGGIANGGMAANGDVSGSISTKDGTVVIPAGNTTGGTVGISTTEKNKIVSGNIKSGVTMLGVSGSSSVVDTTIASSAASAGTIMNGYRAYVNGSLVTGNATVPTVSQDATTKVLTIS